jgi:hypothetical protein
MVVDETLERMLGLSSQGRAPHARIHGNGRDDARRLLAIEPALANTHLRDAAPCSYFVASFD